MLDSQVSFCITIRLVGRIIGLFWHISKSLFGIFVRQTSRGLFLQQRFVGLFTLISFDISLLTLNRSLDQQGSLFTRGGAEICRSLCTYLF